MSDHDRSLIDQVKDALGMGGHRDDDHDHRAADPGLGAEPAV